MKRLDFNASTIDEAITYIKTRAKQLLKLDYKLKSILEIEGGISAIFTKYDKEFQSIYILEPFRGKGLFRKNITHTILTSYECNIEDYLIKNKIDYVIERLNDSIEYTMIENYYGDKRANRSGVFLMNHIDEGLAILNTEQATGIAKRAYCLHPMLQGDDDLVSNFKDGVFENVDPKVLIAAIEYRSVANEYLSKREISSIEEIRVSPLKDVNDMLMADKVQNYKDFLLYHKDTHPRSKELDKYFNNWLQRLNMVSLINGQSFDYYFDLLK